MKKKSDSSSSSRFVAERITKLRIEHNISEYQLSLDLGFSKGYIQAISSGSITPSLGALYNICEYFEITLAQFFAGTTEDAKLLEDLNSLVRAMSPEEQNALYHFLKERKATGASIGKECFNPVAPEPHHAE